ncbi:ANTAR domain-containing protein [Pseudonocardia sp. GCM10023141]|uniref:ANTAR domain-containing protein n=1 Tax=Pseudonocardia sp. GCM10023141 TaxID=3252653 RepID=UPI00361D9F43
MVASHDHDLRNVALELQSILLGAAGVEEFLVEVARRAAGPDTRGRSCGVTVRSGPESPLQGAASDELARRMDDVQYAGGAGPSLQCLRDGAAVVVLDLAVAERGWPAFVRAGRQEGIRAVLSVPLRVPDRSVGALTLYHRRAGGLSAADQSEASRFGDQAAGAVAMALLLADREARERHLETALRSRSTIDQAIGVLMGRDGTSAAEAFGMLRRRSQDTSVKLRDVAAALIADVTRKG